MDKEKVLDRYLRKLNRRDLIAGAGTAVLTGKVLSAQPGPEVGGELNPADLPTLGLLLETLPDHRAVVELTRTIRGNVSYPIGDASPLLELLNRQGGTVRITSHVLTSQHVGRYLPDGFFPIENEADFVRKLLIAFQRGRMQHTYEAAVAQNRRGLRAAVSESSAAVTITGPGLLSMEDCSIDRWRQ
jgi:hypothetical protein